MKIKAVCKIEFHDPLGENNFFELLKFTGNKIKINGKDYYICEVTKDHVSFTELNQSEHEIEIGYSMFDTPSNKGGRTMKEHKCNGCRYKGEHQEMMFRPFGVCLRETNLIQAQKNYNAEVCPYSDHSTKKGDTDANLMKPHTVSQCCTADWCRGYNEAVEKANEIIEALISGQENLQKHISNLNAEIEALNRLLDRKQEEQL